MSPALHALTLPLAASLIIFTSLYILSLREGFHVPRLTTIPAVPRPQLWTPTPSLVPDAHTLPTADAFLPHFRAVTAMRGLSMAEAKAGCRWPNPDAVNFMFGADADWAVQDRNDSEIAFRRQQWQDFVSHDLLPYAAFKHRFQGRGIAVVAGNAQTVQRVKVLIRALRRLRAQLPIEVHYWNDEMTPATKQDLAAVWPRNIYFNDLSAPSNVAPTTYNHFTANYQFKTAAVLNSRFAEVLLLDSDNLPVADPAALFAAPTYTTHGTVFWPDIARTRPNNPAWAITNTACRMDEYEQESGQLLVDKRRYFYHLQLAAWLNNAHGAYYARFLLGDKDLFRFAWHALRTPYGRPARWLTSVGTLNDGAYCGHSFAQHHPDGDGAVAFLHGGLLKSVPPEVVRWQREVNGGVWQAYKRSPRDEQADGVERVTIRWDGGAYFPHKTQDTPIWSCTALVDVEPKPLGELVDGFEKVFEEIGGYWMLDE
ncbi:hypothetical protein PZA11_005674 [Diplocarpon coronariae]|nr:hypothetical protein JHW43_008010 [Diplocarpon mali]